MHRYRAAAKHAAWYDEEGDPNPNYNPFRKIRTRNKDLNHDDEENGLRPLPMNRSESQLTPSIELQRRSQTLEILQQPRHADTMPSSSQPSSGKSPVEGVSSVKDFSRDHEKSQDSGTTESSTVVDSETKCEEKEGKPRRRFINKFPFVSKSTKEEDGEEVKKPRTRSGLWEKDTQTFTAVSQLRATLFNSWVNVLLIFVPIGIAVNFANVPKVGVFVINFIAIIPLAAMLSYATEEIALRTGETIGGLLNATFGNAVELIVSIIALVKNEVDIVQESLIGSMLSNLLLVMGMCFFFGGLNRVEQHFNITVAQTASSLLALAVGSLIIPAAFQAWADGLQSLKSERITQLSRGTAILLLLVYAAYLFFQLKTHASMYSAPSIKVEKRRTKVEEGDSIRGIANIGAGISASMGGSVTQETPMREPEQKELPQLSKWVALFTLAASTALVAICAEFMVDSIDAITQGGNAAEHATAVTVACKDKMDLAIGVAVGSSMQIALLVIPFTVVLGWIMGNAEMNLAFDGFQIAVLFVAVLLVNYLIQDGKSHWLEGVLLQVLYMIIALAAWFYPADDPSTLNTR
ncbi:MAG: hypothetical protein ASARMPRED_009220 [Alectoria sarmentosa]|nr:MAG: hypothetical protein ASARMPRED_009220 [Alectoria sarmentosa]